MFRRPWFDVVTNSKAKPLLVVIVPSFLFTNDEMFVCDVYLVKEVFIFSAVFLASLLAKHRLSQH